MVAAAAAVTEERALSLLRANSQVRFGTNKAGEAIVQLRKRT